MKPKQLLIALMLMCAVPMMAQQYPYLDTKLSSQQRAEDLCSRLTLQEKALLMQDNSPAIPRLGIPQFEWWNEALHGVGRNGTATVFPITMAMAASWNNNLVYDVFTAVSDEARAKYQHAKNTNNMAQYRGLSFWTPNINIFRDPRWGRGQETYGEDPYLTSMMGLAVVRGLQGDSNSKYRKLLACAKHFAVHSGPEWNRHQFNIETLPERDLWETYLPAFKSLVEDGNVAEVMCAYQRFEGEPCCGSNRLLQQILRNDWNFKGIVVSDCGAISDFWVPGHHGVSPNAAQASAKAVLSGTDLECGTEYASLPEAIKAGAITEEQIDISMTRLLKERIELGEFDPDEMVEWTKIPYDVVASKEHKQLALQMAREGITLLQNRNNILPLSKNGLKIAVLGQNAVDSTMQWGNYNGFPTHTTTILEGIKAKTNDVKFIEGCGLTRNEIFESRYNEIRNGLNGEAGMRAVYHNEGGKEIGTTEVNLAQPINLSNGGGTPLAPNVSLNNFSARYEGTFIPTRSEDVLLNLAIDSKVTFVVNSDTLINNDGYMGEIRRMSHAMTVEAGKEYRISIDYKHVDGLASVKFDIVRKAPVTTTDILAKVGDADVVVFAGGISPRLEGEEMPVSEEGFKGGDRTSIELPKAQRDMIAALHNAGKQVVFINCSGSAIALTPETENADAILQAWYPGEQGGTAVADVLFGDYNPSGKLPVTFYANTEQLPDFEDYTMHNRTYRYFQGKPLFPFGYGLSYTTFAFGKPKYANDKVNVEVTNTGKMDGTEVVQVYVRNISDKEGPIKSLRGFARVNLKVGETRTVEIPFEKKNFEGWDATTNTIRTTPGTYEIMIGGSSQDKDLTKTMVKFNK